jgi:hypothetical protein
MATLELFYLAIATIAKKKHGYDGPCFSAPHLLGKIERFALMS